MRYVVYIQILTSLVLLSGCGQQASPPHGGSKSDSQHAVEGNSDVDSIAREQINGMGITTCTLDDSSDLVDLKCLDSTSLQGVFVKTYVDTVREAFLVLYGRRGEITRGLSTEKFGFRSSSSFRFDSLLGPNSHQLIISVDNGGAHCCTVEQILDLGDSIRIIFDGTSHPDLGFGVEPRDLDSDGRMELVCQVSLFDYFKTSHVSSAFPSVVFKYSPALRHYTIASKQFQTYLLSDEVNLTRDLAQCRSDTLRDEGSEVSDRCYPLIMKIVLQEMYAGRVEDAWKFFAEHYQGVDRDTLRAEIVRILSYSPTFQAANSE